MYPSISFELLKEIIKQYDEEMGEYPELALEGVAVLNFIEEKLSESVPEERQPNKRV